MAKHDDLDYDVDYLYRIDDEDEDESDSEMDMNAEEGKEGAADENGDDEDVAAMRPSHVRQMQVSRKVPPHVASSTRAVTNDTIPDESVLQNDFVRMSRMTAEDSKVNQEVMDLKEAVYQLFLSVCSLYEIIRSSEFHESDNQEESKGSDDLAQSSQKRDEGGGGRGRLLGGVPWWILVNLGGNVLLLLLVLLLIAK